MPLIHSSKFRVRFYECDPFGHMNNANHLRLMQEAAFNASESIGFDRDKYKELGYVWLIRETEIDFLRPVFFGALLEIKTWVGDMFGVRSRRFYEFRMDGKPDLAAKAFSDWVFVDASFCKPTKIPDEISKAYFQQGENRRGIIRERFPKPALPSQQIFSSHRRVEWRDLDPWGHVQNATYLSYFEDCGMQVAQKMGWTWEKMRDAGFNILARRHHIEYRTPVFLDDQLEVVTWLSNIRGPSAVRHYQISRNGSNEVVATCNTLYVWVDVQTGKPIRIPDEFLRDFLWNVSPESIRNR